MTTAFRILGLLALAALLLVPVLPLGPAQEYIWHVIIQIFLWSFVGNAWSLMGRFGLVSLGHGAFLGVGAYATVLLWNFFGLTPWLGAALALLLTVAFALVVAYPCSRFQVVGHYFALVTLAVGEVIRLLIVAERDWTGGSLGVSLKTASTTSDWWTLQFTDKRVFYYIGMAAWLFGLWVWWRVDRSMARSAMEAIGEDETAAASVGIRVTRFKMGITALSAALTALGGALLALYLAYANPDTLSGIGVSLRIVFAVVLGGMYSLLGPFVGTALTIALSEYLRIYFGIKLIGIAETIYGLLLMIFIIFLPAGIYGSIRDALFRRLARPSGGAAAALGACVVATMLAGCAGEGGVTLRGGQTPVQLAEDRTRCVPFVQAHRETSTELAEVACLIARGYRAPLSLAQGPAPPIGSLYATADRDATAMVGDFQACRVEAFNTPMPEIRDERSSGIFSHLFGEFFPRGAFVKAATPDEWALRSFAACLARRGYTVSDITGVP
jgi:branched-chain amino acid transport system permease protein